jgi:hypothetical protein
MRRMESVRQLSTYAHVVRIHRTAHATRSSCRLAPTSCTNLVSSRPSTSLPITSARRIVSADRGFVSTPARLSNDAEQHDRWLRSQERARQAAAQEAASRGGAGSGTSGGSHSGGGGSGSGSGWRFGRAGPKVRRSLDDYVLGAVVLTNVYVFCVWAGGGRDWNQLMASGSVAHQMMCKHAIMSPHNIEEDRYHTVLTHGFAHYRFAHLASNMFIFLIVGRGVIKAVGTRAFMPIYFGGAIAASVASLMVNDYVNKKYPGLRETSCVHERPDTLVVRSSPALIARCLSSPPVPSCPVLVCVVV